MWAVVPRHWPQPGLGRMSSGPPNVYTGTLRSEQQPPSREPRYPQEWRPWVCMPFPKYSAHEAAKEFVEGPREEPTLPSLSLALCLEVSRTRASAQTSPRGWQAQPILFAFRVHGPRESPIPACSPKPGDRSCGRPGSRAGLGSPACGEPTEGLLPATLKHGGQAGADLSLGPPTASEREQVGSLSVRILTGEAAWAVLAAQHSPHASLDGPSGVASRPWP